MAAVSSFPQLTETEVHTRLVNRSVQEIIEISRDNERRKELSKTESRHLTKGCFNPIDYFFTVEEKNLQNKLASLRKNDYAFHGFASQDHFEMKKEEGFTQARKVTTFFLKKGAVPSEAIHKMKEGLTLFGCAEAVQLPQYLAIEDVVDTYTPGKFNALFAADSKTPLIIGSQSENNPISLLRNYMEKPVSPDSEEIKKGDHIYYPNAKSYLEKHLNGPSRGYNLLCIDDAVGAQKFTTLGISSAGNTSTQMQDHCIARYALPYRSMEAYSETTKKEFRDQFATNALEKSQSMANATITVEEFKAQGGGDMQIVDELDVKRITALANATIEEARKLMDSYTIRVYGDRQMFSN